MNASALPALDVTLAGPTVHLDEADERLVLHLEPSLSVVELETALRLLLDTRPDLRNRGVSLGFSDREVALFDLRRLTRFLAEDYGLTVAAVVVTERALLRYAQAELKVRLQVESQERSWSMGTARPLPMAPAHLATTAVCGDPAADDTVERVAAFAVLGCSASVEEDAASELAVCPADETPLLDNGEEPCQEAQAGHAEGAAEPGSEPEEETGSAEPEAQAVPVVVEANEDDEPPAETPPTEAGRVQTLHRTLRSGSTIRHNGDLIVFGDVNAGAQVVADGNIVVLGALRGVAHAGARGDESASVVALDLQSTQVRIASHIALAPERAEATGSRLRTLLQRERPAERLWCPEIAQLQDGAIVFGPFRGRLSPAGRS